MTFSPTSWKAEDGLLELERFDLEEDLGLFLRTAWPHIVNAEFVDGWVIDAIAEHLQAVCDGDIRRLIINLPPRTLKSTLTSIMFPAWVWAQRFKSHTSGPGVKFLHASHSEALALRDSRECRRLIETKWFQKLWGGRMQFRTDMNTMHRWGFDSGGERLIKPISAGVTGEGYDVAIIDDPNSAADMSSEVKPETVIEWWETTMSTRMNDPKRSAHIIIQQRLSHVDLTGHILDKHPEDYTTLILPMHYDPSRVSVTSIGWVDPRSKPGELLWPERFGEKEVFALQRDLGPWSAPGQLEQLPTPRGGGIIKSDWWNTWESEQFPRFDYIIASLDSAYTEKKENDPSAMTVWGVFSVDGPDLFQVPEKAILRDGMTVFGGARRIQRPAEQHPKVILINAWQGHYDFNTLVTKVAQTCRVPARGCAPVDKLLIENKASGISVAQEFRRQFSDDRLTVQLVDPRGKDKVERLHAVVPLFAPALDIHGNAVLNAEGNIKFPGVVWAPNKDFAQMVINQCSDFPKGKRDDLVDCTSIALGHLRVLNMLKRTEEWSVEEGASMTWHGSNPGPIYPT